MEKFIIIENTEKAKEEFEEDFYGGGTYYITKEQIKALEEGKCLATSVNMEYSIIIMREKNEI